MQQAQGEVTKSATYDDQLTHLRTKHRQLKERLKGLDEHAYLTPDEQVERKQIQKMKLVIKDQIHLLTREESFALGVLDSSC